MRILFATTEAAPYYKTGGLADVSRSLPDALAARGHDVLVVHPYYAPVAARGLELTDVGGASLAFPGRRVPVRYLEHRPERGAPALFVEQDRFFAVDRPYESESGDPLEPARRFALFCRAIVERARVWDAEVVHLNDWGTALVPAYGLVDGLDAATVFAIHNLAYQGNFPPRALAQIGLPQELFRTENGVEFFGTVSFMKGGIALADRIVTVSPTYAREIQTHEYGAGMDGLLRFRRRMLHGILNGLDPERWDPSSDANVPVHYDADSIDRKDRNREFLLGELSLEDAHPLFVMVTRLAHQKGIDLVLEALPAILHSGASLAVLGDGEEAYAELLRRETGANPGRVAVRFGFDERLAKLLYSGGDFFLMPSLYEPCGLGQLIAQRFGTPPVVRATGGLADTVIDGQTGYSFVAPEPRALGDAVARAVCDWRGERWNEMRRRCMRLDWSWRRSAGAYEDVYRAAIGDVMRGAERPGREAE